MSDGWKAYGGIGELQQQYNHSLLVEKVSQINYIGHNFRALSSRDKSIPEESEDAFNSSDEELIVVHYT
uniref:ISXO2-like transposase domain-containing protein n=1 Tax=Acrobeloides nanus TaxID=290746 RepID=A0A914CQ82_9BILA